MYSEYEESLRATYPFGNKFLEQYIAVQASPSTSWERLLEESEKHQVEMDRRHAWLWRLIRIRPR